MNKTTKEHPILFSTEMVKAILDGRKTQTRRIVKRLNGRGSITELLFNAGRFFFRDKNALWNDVEKKYLLDRCPYGQPGDLLWVREAFRLQNFDSFKGNWTADICYRVDDGIGRRVGHLSENERIGWRPSIHMPRWASRIALQVTGVRVERVQDISENDAKAEGVTEPEYPEYGFTGWATAGFAELWDKINAKRGHSWDSNPWVWVVEFKRL